MTTYYVKNGGSDGANGLSDGTAWATISKVNGLVQAPGDTVLFKAGSTWREQLNPDVGSAGNYVTYGSYGSGSLPIITGADAVTGWTVYSGTAYRAAFTTTVAYPGAWTTHPSYPYLALTTTIPPPLGRYALSGGYVYVNIGTSPAAYTVEVTKRQYGVNNVRSYNRFTTLHIPKCMTGLGQWAPTSNYCEISYCLFDWLSDQAIYAGDPVTGNVATNWWIHHNSFAHIGGSVSGTRGRHGIYLKGCSSNTIEYNTYDDTGLGYTYGNGGSGINLNSSSNNIIRFNQFSRCHTSSIQIFQDTAAYGSANNQIYGNISVNDYCFIYENGLNHSANDLYNNTIFQPVYAGLSLDSAGLRYVKNNIFVMTGSLKAYQMSVGFTGSSNNCIYGGSGGLKYNGVNYASLAAMRTATGQEANSITADPKLDASYQLLSGSPCIDAGVNVGLPYQGSAPDMGAIETAVAMVGTGGGVAGGSAVISSTLLKSYAIIGAGGAVVAGDTPIRKGTGIAGTGGGVADGTATIQTQGIIGMAVTGTGGAVTGGSATISSILLMSLDVVGSGGAISAGDATVSKGSSPTAAGGGIAGGTASLSWQGVSGFILTGSGGAIADGSAVIEARQNNDLAYAGSGGAVVGGSAEATGGQGPFDFIGSGGAVAEGTAIVLLHAATLEITGDGGAIAGGLVIPVATLSDYQVLFVDGRWW
jgi:hypothetical protein